MPSENWPARLRATSCRPTRSISSVDAARRDPVRLGEREEMVVRRPPGVDGARLEQRADLVQRRGVLAVVAAVDGDVAARGRVEAEDQAHRRGLAGAVRPEEAR